MWIWLLALVCLGLVAALVIRGARDSGSAPEAEPNDKPLPATNAPASSDAASPSVSQADKPAQQTPSSLALLCQDGRLTLAGRKLERSTTLSWLREVLGPATRTNQAGAQNKVVHAFDRFGLLVYANAAGDAENIMLDYEALGGNDGATEPFRGTIAVEGHLLRAETNPAQLSAMKALSIETKPATGIFSGSYGQVNFTFAYLKDTNRLSIVQVDL